MAAIEAKASTLAQSILYLKGNLLNFENYKPFLGVYDYLAEKTTLKCGRQIGKSVSLGGKAIINSVSVPYFHTLYLAPLSEQTKRFSTGYLVPFMNGRIIRNRFMDANSAKNVFEKSFVNNSRIYLSYAETELDADRIRGIMADQILFDETQDIQYDALPPIQEVLSASEYGYQNYAGTSKNLNNTLEYMFNRSNQMEWVMKCQHCKYDIIPNEYEICMKIVSKKEGPCCPYCGRMIDVRHGRWVPMQPSVKDHMGFHIPQFTVAANTSPKKWLKLYNKIADGGYNRVKINNEVFGLADESAGKTFSINEAQRCCNGERREWDRSWARDSRGIVCVVLGVDWSVSDSTSSYTIISILGYDYQGKCYVLFSEKQDGSNITAQVERVAQLASQYDCMLIASDRGVGVLQAEMLQKIFGADKVIPINYVSSASKLAWNRKGGFVSADRTQAMDNVAARIRMGRARFETPAWGVTASFWQDALNIHEEETMSHRRVYRKEPGLTDDWYHSIVFADLGYKIIHGEIEPG